MLPSYSSGRQHRSPASCRLWPAASIPPLRPSTRVVPPVPEACAGQTHPLHMLAERFCLDLRLHSPWVEADDSGRRHVREPEQRFPGGLAHISIHRNGRQCLSALRQTGLMVLGDVHARLAQQRADPTDYAGHVIIRENQERITWLYIHVKGTDSGKSRG